MYPLTNLFGLSVSTYSLLVIAGFLIGLAVALFRKKVYGMRTDDLLASLFIAAGGALLGAKLFFVAQGLPGFLANSPHTWEAFVTFFMRAGLVYYGGLIGGILFLLMGAKLVGAPVWGTLDTVLPSVPLMHAIGRIGCFSAGCCFGMPSEFGFYFTASPFAPHDEKLFPIQLAEAACLFALFFFMQRYGREKRAPGKVLSVYLISYGVIRFILEFFRYDKFRGIYGAFSISQWVSLALIGLGLFFWFVYPRLKKGKQPHCSV